MNSIKLTKEQKQAVKDYEYALKQEDRYLGSVFANAYGQKLIEEKTAIAYKKAELLGVSQFC
jgi:hypothetical protein